MLYGINDDNNSSKSWRANGIVNSYLTIIMCCINLMITGVSVEKILMYSSSAVRLKESYLSLVIKSVVIQA